jgi:subtilisin
MKKVTLAALLALTLVISLIQVPAQATLEEPGQYSAAQQVTHLALNIGRSFSSQQSYSQQEAANSEQAEGQGAPPATPAPTPPGGTDPQRKRQAPQALAPARANTYASLREKARENGKVRVMVRLDVNARSEGALSPSQATQQRQDIAQAQDSVLDKLTDGEVSSITRFKFVPFLAMDVDEEAMAKLATMDGVASMQEDMKLNIVQEDNPVTPPLADNIPLIGVDNVWNDGFTGEGQAVAVLDTGVDKTHAFFAGKTVSEACFSTTSDITTTLCPNERDEHIGSGAGVNCPLSIRGCDHGTHVAGIVLGNGDGLSGVARDADLIAIQVFSRVDSDEGCNPGAPPCIAAFNSDVVQGLERVLELHNDPSFTPVIASVNLSLGGELLPPPDCDTHAPSIPTRMAVANLRDAGIVTIAATGNNFVFGAISTPACLSNVVSVGATNNSDVVARFSNCASNQDVLAPGVSINSSLPGGGFGTKSGTSMATPHMAGAWALARDKSSLSRINAVLLAFVSTGTPVSDSDCPTKPRINVDSAMNQLPPDSIPCSPPPSGNWTIPASQPCTLSQNATILGNVIVEAGSTLTVAPDVTLNIDFSTNHLRILDGARVVVQDGGKIE